CVADRNRRKKFLLHRREQVPIGLRFAEFLSNCGVVELRRQHANQRNARAITARAQRTEVAHLVTLVTLPTIAALVNEFGHQTFTIRTATVCEAPVAEGGAR